MRLLQCRETSSFRVYILFSKQCKLCRIYVSNHVPRGNHNVRERVDVVTLLFLTLYRKVITINISFNLFRFLVDCACLR
nr:MAG TPA: hypothetical protein [Ackermannviridae sp.]